MSEICEKMDNASKVTVIIPAYNVENSLRICLDSVLQQTWINKEIIVINDGSSDRTKDIAESYAHHIRYLEQENSGQGAARNAGLRLASGSFIAFLDADDYWQPTFLERTLTFLQENPNLVAVLTSWIKRLGNNQNSIVPSLMHESPIGQLKPFQIESFYRFWVEQGHIQTGAIAIRKDVIDRAGYMLADLRVSQDLEYWTLLASQGPWGFIPEPLFVSNSRQASHSNWASKYEMRRKLCPTVAQWEARIRPLIRAEELHDYRVIRGRVAAAFAYNLINGGRAPEALVTVQRYGAEMPNNKVVSLLRQGKRFPGLIWPLCCTIIRLYERSKIVLYQAQSLWSRKRELS